jgi:hypothetical protein
MPCATCAGSPVAGISYCPNYHVIRYCAVHYAPEAARAGACATCGGALTFTTDDRECLRVATEEHNRSRAAPAPPPPAPPPPRPPPPPPPPPPAAAAAAAAASGTDPIAADIAGERWRELREMWEKRKAVAVVGDYPGTRLVAFRKWYGLREPREAGFPGADVAVSVLCRVSPVETAATGAHRAAEPVTLVSTSNRGPTMATLQPPATVGYVAMVPCPIRFTDDPLDDRHPLKLAAMYCLAFTDRATAWRRLRVLLAVNIRDDWRFTGERTREAAELVARYVALLNAAFIHHDLPARAVAFLWGPQVVKSTAGNHGVTPVARADVVELNLDPTQPIRLSTDEIRARLATEPPAKMFSNKPKGAEFPFASFRAALTAVPEAARMVRELMDTNRAVFLHTGDADLITINPVLGRSLFSLYDAALQNIGTRALERYARIGGAFQFEVADIRAHILRLNLGLSGLAVTQSVLLTLVAKTLDTAVRTALCEQVEAAAYYAEPNTLINAALADSLQLSTCTNLCTSPMPDWSSTIATRVVAEGYRQCLLGGLGHQLSTSSRNALVIYRDSSDGIDPRRHTRIATTDNWVRVLRRFKNEHNTQIAESQLNERFKEAGIALPAASVRSCLPAPSSYRCSLLEAPGVVARAVWASGEAEATALAAAYASTAGDIEGYFRAMLPTVNAATLEAEAYTFANRVDEIHTLSIFRELITTLRRAALDYDTYPQVYDALIVIDIVFRWGIGMVRRIERLT